jgi:hypothetical protein
MKFIDLIIRRIVAWPLIIVGAGLVSFGGEFIRLGAWIVNIDVSDVA